MKILQEAYPQKARVHPTRAEYHCTEKKLFPSRKGKAREIVGMLLPDFLLLPYLPTLFGISK